MSALTEFARDQPCLVRLPDCLGTVDTTVAAHYRSVSLGAGTSHKPADWLAAHACFNCHNVIDGRVFIPGLGKAEVRLAHAEGVFRTMAKLIDAGLIRLGRK